MREVLHEWQGANGAFSLSWLGSILRTILAYCVALMTFPKSMGARALNWLCPACQATIDTLLPPVFMYTRFLLGIV